VNMHTLPTPNHMTEFLSWVRHISWLLTWAFKATHGLGSQRFGFQP